MEPTKYHVFFSVKYYRTRINKGTILQIGYPKRIRLLVNPERKELIVQPCNEHEPLAYKVPKDFGHNKHGLEINSLSLMTVLCKTFGWDKTVHYKAYGRYVEKENIVVFDLADCEAVEGSED